MANRQQPQDQQQKGRRNPMQTSPDDDEAQVADQSNLSDEESGRDEATEGLPADGQRRALQPSQEREEERLAQAGGEDEADDAEDLDDADEDDEDEEKENLSGM